MRNGNSQIYEFLSSLSLIKTDGNQLMFAQKSDIRMIHSTLLKKQITD